MFHACGVCSGYCNYIPSNRYWYFFSLEGYDGADMVGLVGFCRAGECA